MTIPVKYKIYKIMEVNIELLCQDKDVKFDAIPTLSWYPWVGKVFFTSRRRILIVAESHYNEGERVDELNRIILNRKYTTRNVVQYYPVSHQDNNPMFENLHRCLFRTNNINRENVWSHIAFYNFVQRSMDYNRKERPADADWVNGWKTFVEVVKILKPTDCMFVGVGAADKFNENASLLDLNHENVQWIKVNNCRGAARRFSLTIDDNYKLNCTSIQHTSHHFSWKAWNAYLWNENIEMMRCLNEWSGGNSSGVEKDEDYIDVEGKQPPFWLQHKPIYSCDYQQICPGSDLRFITVGRAQWNNKLAAAVKTFRWDERNKKWARMSEEIPIDRLPHMTMMLLSAINAIQKGRDNKKATPTYLNETFVTEEREFLEDQFYKNRETLKKSLAEIKRLLTEIDIEGL